MDVATGQHDVGEEAAELCAVPPNGVRVRNLGGSRIFIGGPDVTSGSGYPVEPGSSEDFSAPPRKEAPVVPAPPGDTAPYVLYAVTEQGTGTSKVAVISVG
jgi:hypothetical protein